MCPWWLILCQFDWAKDSQITDKTFKLSVLVRICLWECFWKKINKILEEDLSLSMWVSITQPTEDLDCTKSWKKRKFSLCLFFLKLKLLSSPAFRYLCPWFSGPWSSRTDTSNSRAFGPGIGVPLSAIMVQTPNEQHHWLSGSPAYRRDLSSSTIQWAHSHSVSLCVLRTC